MIEIKRMDKIEDLHQLEEIRYDAFQANYCQPNEMYIKEFKNNNLIMYGLFYNGELCAGCYVTILMESIFIDELFVKQKYQNTGLKLGRVLLRYINNDKNYINEKMKTNINISRLIYFDEKSKALYEKENYIDTGYLFHMMEKTLK